MGWRVGGPGAAQEALAHAGRQRGAAAPAAHGRRGGRAVGEALGGRCGRCGEAGCGAWGSACDQWSSSAGLRGTLVRHCVYPRRGRGQQVAQPAPLAPAALARGVALASTGAVLIAGLGSAPGTAAGQACAGSAAVDLAAVTVAAQQGQGVAAGAPEHTRGMVHAHLGRAEGAGRTRPGAPHCGGTSLLGTVQGAAWSPACQASGAAAAPTCFGVDGVVAHRATEPPSGQSLRCNDPPAMAVFRRLRVLARHDPRLPFAQRRVRLPGRPEGGQADELILRAGRAPQ